MPAAIAVPLITGAIGAGATVYGARSAGKSARRASEVQSRADMAALEDARQQREEERRRWEAEQDFQRQQWEAQEEERAYARQLQEEREARQAPYRQASQAALGNLGQLLGINFPVQQTPPPMPGAAIAATAQGPTPVAPPVARVPPRVPVSSGMRSGMPAPLVRPRRSLGDLTGLSQRFEGRF